MSGAILYSFRRCPYAMRARMALSISKMEYEHREIVLRDKPASMLAYSPKGTVPVFITKDGTVIDESEDIMLWALSHYDPHDWRTNNIQAQLALMHIISEDFKPHLDRYKYASRYQEDTDRRHIDLAHRKSAYEILQDFEARLSKAPYLTGAQPHLADYGTFAFIRQFSNVERAWWDRPIFPHIHDWLESLLASDLFKQVMQKHPLWIDSKPV